MAREANVGGAGTPALVLARKRPKLGTADAALAALVIGVVGLMVVPLPTPLLDLLLSVNIAAAVTLLLVSLYVSDALRFATFPPPINESPLRQTVVIGQGDIVLD